MFKKLSGADDRLHDDLATRLQLNFSPVNDDSDEMTSGDEEKRSVFSILCGTSFLSGKTVYWAQSIN